MGWPRQMYIYNNNKHNRNCTFGYIIKYFVIVLDDGEAGAAEVILVTVQVMTVSVNNFYTHVHNNNLTTYLTTRVSILYIFMFILMHIYSTLHLGKTNTLIHQLISICWLFSIQYHSGVKYDGIPSPPPFLLHPVSERHGTLSIGGEKRLLVLLAWEAQV